MCGGQLIQKVQFALEMARPMAQYNEFVENGFKNWALVRIATTGHDCK